MRLEEDPVSVAVAYALLMCVPWLGYYGAEKFLDWVTTARPRRGVQRELRSLDQLVADLRRIDAEYRRTEASDVPARGARLRALALAYDDVLRACCRLLGLPEPPTAPLRALDRLETEAALAQRGLSW